MGLIEDVGEGPVGLDTAVFVYFIEENQTYLPHVEPLFRAIDEQKLTGVTSAITLLETLVVPYRAGDDELAREYETILTRSPGLELIELGRPLLRLAAELRAVTGMRTPDALQIAATVSAGCRVFVTNDRRLPQLPGLTVLQLREYLSRA